MPFSINFRNRPSCQIDFFEIYKTRDDFPLVLVDMFINEGMEGTDIVCGLMLQCESNLTLAQDIMFSEEALQSAVEDAAE